MLTLEDTIYRPPVEEKSVLLEISIGCSYGQCTFCQFSNNQTPLQMTSDITLSDNLQKMADNGETRERMFLTGGNVFAFKSKYLIDLFNFVQLYLPSVHEFCMYGRIGDIKLKTDEQLRDLKKAGLATVYVGIESGNDDILRHFHKGQTIQQVEEQLGRLEKFGIHYGLSSILGMGSVAMSRQNALDTAALYNRLKPESIRIMTLTPIEGTPFAKEVEEGKFLLLTDDEILDEEICFLESLDLGAHTFRFVASHGSNSVKIAGNMPEDKDKMLEVLRKAKEKGLPKREKELLQW